MTDKPSPSARRPGRPSPHNLDEGGLPVMAATYLVGTILSALTFGFMQ
ncbi:MAG: hypothetical protein ACE5LU_09655 [Anaerolineae bacterium]